MSLPDSADAAVPGRRPVLFLVVLVALLALPSLATRELMPTDEPRFALVARQMMEDPAPIVPHLGYDPLTRKGEIYGDKPPVFFWAISLFSLLTGGVSELSARLPSFLAAIAAVLLTRRIGILLADEATGFAAGAILATSNQFFLRAGWCSIDMLLTAFTLAAAYCWLAAARVPRGGNDGGASTPLETPGASASERGAGSRGSPASSRSIPASMTTAARAGGRRALGLAALGGLFAAAATLSKGPVGLVFPLVFLAGDRAAAHWPSWRRAAGIERPAAQAARVARRQAEGAMTSGEAAAEARSAEATLMDGPAWPDPAHAAVRVAPVLVAALGFALPILLWIAAILVVGGPDYVREILFRQNVTRYVAAWNNQQPWYYYLHRLPIGLLPWTLLLPAALIVPRGLPEPKARPLRGLLVASAAIFLFFSASTGKRGVYLLPLYPVLAILLASAWRRIPERPFGAIASAQTIVLATLGVLALGGVPLVAARQAPGLLPAAFLLGPVIAAVTVGAAIAFFRGRPWRSLRIATGGIAAIVAIASFFVVPEANRRSGLRSFGAQLAAIARPDDSILVDQEGYEQILFYSRLKGTRRSFARTRFSVAEDGSIVLTPAGAAPLESPGPSRLTEAQRAARAIRFPAGARVLFVMKGSGVERLRAALGPSSRTLLAAKIQGDPVFVVASR